MSLVSVTHFTDPGCPFAYSAEPQLWRLKWIFGEQLEWTTKMVGLAHDRGEYAAKGMKPEFAQAGAIALEASHGMPFDLSLRSELAGTVPACWEVVAVRSFASHAQADRLLRELRIQTMVYAQPLDELATLRAASHAAGIDSDELDHWTQDVTAEEELQADMHAARHPLPSALALPERLAKWEGGLRYTCPSLVLESKDGTVITAAGFIPEKAYDLAFANACPDLIRRDLAEDPLAVLHWALTPLATAEVAAVMGVDRETARAGLTAGGANEHTAGSDAFWSL